MEVVELQSKIEALQFALIALMAGVVLLWRAPAPCVCEHCGHHRQERVREAQEKRETAHDRAHRGYNPTSGAPDIYRCSDRDCSRNPK